MWTDSGLYQCAVELTLFVMLIFTPALTKLWMILQRFSCPLSDFASELNLDWAAHIRGPQIDCWVKKKGKKGSGSSNNNNNNNNNNNRNIILIIIIYIIIICICLCVSNDDDSDRRPMKFYPLQDSKLKEKRTR